MRTHMPCRCQGASDDEHQHLELSGNTGKQYFPIKWQMGICLQSRGAYVSPFINRLMDYGRHGLPCTVSGELQWAVSSGDIRDADMVDRRLLPRWGRGLRALRW